MLDLVGLMFGDGFSGRSILGVLYGIRAGKTVPCGRPTPAGPGGRGAPAGVAKTPPIDLHPSSLIHDFVRQAFLDASRPPPRRPGDNSGLHRLHVHSPGSSRHGRQVDRRHSGLGPPSHRRRDRRRYLGAGPGDGEPNDAVVRLPEHADCRATCTNVNSVLVRATPLATSMHVLGATPVTRLGTARNMAIGILTTARSWHRHSLLTSRLTPIKHDRRTLIKHF